MNACIASSIWSRGKSARFHGCGFLLCWRSLICAGAFVAAGIRAQDPIAIGLDLLILQDPSLTGKGARMAQPEGGAPLWEVNTNTQPLAVINYYASSGTTTVFPNNLGTESGHADLGRNPPRLA